MVGITSYGAYIPWYRMNRAIIFEQLGWFNPANASVARGEKAVANYDEDSVTMAVAAALDCLGGQSREGVDGLYLASTSLPFAQRQNAVIVSQGLDLPPGVRTADFGGSTKVGTTALLAALDAAESGSMMVCASENRLAKPGSSQEHTYGDGAAAFLTGNEDVLAQFKGSFSVSTDFIDFRRTQEEKFPHAWEERWIRDAGYARIIPQAVAGLLDRHDLKIADFAKVILACPVAGAVKGLLAAIGASPEQMQDTMMDRVGDTGAALPLMMLAAALEEAHAGDKLLVASYGSGSDALWFEVTDRIEAFRTGARQGVKGHLAARNDLSVYGKYLVFRNLIPLEVGIRGEEVTPTAMTVLGRDGNAISALVGSRCRACGTPQYPKQRICVNPDCGAVDDMEEYRFSDKTGTLTAYTGDNLAFSWDPPQIYGLVDFEDGGRILLDLTDCSLDSVKVKMPVTLSFRRKYADPQRGYYGYFWKAVPVK
ncbi:MAG: hydroxymethylglutaryl-CoA synthase family protein [Deltaproteobacteria bacterium]|nr:hydroxymethylglutaryl-CoA synthase family protein [Deltaproteobacteria bacterium]